MTATDTTTEKRLVVHMTGRRPISIVRDDWPLIAWGVEEEYNGQVRDESHETGDASIRVRQHSDGRLLVYGAFAYVCGHPNSPSHDASAGAIYPAGSDIAEAIDEIVETMHAKLAKQSRGQYVPCETLIDRAAQGCLADLEPEAI